MCLLSYGDQDLGKQEGYRNGKQGMNGEMGVAVFIGLRDSQNGRV